MAGKATREERPDKMVRLRKSNKVKLIDWQRENGLGSLDEAIYVLLEIARSLKKFSEVTYAEPTVIIKEG